MNRLQAGDLKTFLSLQTDKVEKNLETEYIPRHDQAELAVMQQGLGEVIYDDEFSNTLSEFGIEFGPEQEG